LSKVDRRANFSVMARLGRVVISGLPRHVRQRSKGGAPTILGDAAFPAALEAAAQRRLRPTPRGPKAKERG
jgi:voltage-gated potassium channel Kch